MANGTVCIDREAIVNMTRLLEELQDRLEAIELASDPDFMESLKKSKEEIKKGDVISFNDL